MRTLKGNKNFTSTIMMNLEKNVVDGNFDQAQIMKRTARAVNVLNSCEITDNGLKTNGWGEHVRAYSVIKSNGKGYEVQIRTANGQGSCNCPDWINRRKVNGGFCKHVLAVQAIEAE